MNKNRLEFEMKERGITIDALCSGIGISRSAFYRKCNGKSEFTLPEINGIIRLLSLSSEVASLIFLARICLKRYFWRWQASYPLTTTKGGPDMTTPRMRTAEGLMEIIKAEDPDTAVTLRAIRRMIHTGEIPSTAVGCKRLVNVDLVLRYLAGEASSDAPSPPTYSD